ncbi:MAG: hypothetical protein RL699_911 [Bacteroidota bacterium]|jgi:hypothetical protein
MKVNSVVLFLSLIVLGTSCSKSDIAAPGSCDSSIPFLETGKTFTYKSTQFGFDAGTIKFTVGACNGTGFLVSRQQFSTTGVEQTSATDLWKQDGDFLLSDSSFNGDYFSKIYKKNAVLGETWEVTRPDGSIVTHEVVDIDSLVTVPAGEFHCKVFKYSTTSAINESHIFWVDEIGQIKEDAGFIVNELQSYN